MAIVRWEPLRELTTLQNEMNRLFGTVFDAPAPGNGGTLRRWMPAMDLVETDEPLRPQGRSARVWGEQDVNIELENSVPHDRRRAQGRARGAATRATPLSSARPARSRAP